MTFEEFLKDYAALIVSLILGLPGLYSMISLIRQEKLRMKALEESNRKAAAETNTEDARAAEVFGKLARDTAQDAIAKSDLIRGMEKRLNEMQEKIECLSDSNESLTKENEILRQDNIRLEGITRDLEARVQELESILKEHKIPFPERKSTRSEE